MRRIPASIVLLGTALGLAACGSPKQEAPADSGTETAAATESASAAASDAVPTAFAQCKVCHATTPGTNGVGPSLAGVVGRKAGSVAGFAYSTAMKDSGKTWDEATLDTYLTAPMKDVPGTKMSFAGLTDAAKRKEVIDYLKTLK